MEPGTNAEPLLLTLNEAARRARISRTSLYRMRDAGLGPRETRLGRRVLVTETALCEWIEQRQSRTAAAD
jgi:excisionase family DNA binding protein